MSILPASTRVGRVRLQVADLERSLGFYRDLIGFRVLGRGEGVARLGANPAPSRGSQEEPAGSGPGSGERGDAVLLELVERPGARSVPRTGLLGLYHFALLLPGRAALGRFVRHQARLGSRFGAADHAFSEALYLEDPDGLTLEVYADRPEGQWKRDADDALPLVSDPLDTPGLMEAAGDGSWEGVPPGATIGHMHFFVDDLDAARAFYVEGLGFDVMIPHPTALFVAAGGYHHHVGVNTWRAGAPPATDDHARLLDWELVVPEPGGREAAVRRLRDAGVTAEQTEAGTLARDPWGITVRITD